MRQIDDGPPTVLALGATVLLLTSSGLTSWIAYVYGAPVVREVSALASRRAA